MDLDYSVLSTASPWAYAAAFIGGIITSIGPCNVTMIPLVIAFVGGQKDISRGRSLVLSSAFAFGLALTLMATGVAASLVGGLVGGSSRVWYYVVASVCIVMGSYWAGIISLPVPDLAAAQRERIKVKGLAGALLLGLVSGFVASGCATPALAAIVTLVMSRGAVAYGAGLLLTYGLGRGVPIVLFGTFAGLLKQIPRIAQWSARLERASGALMVITGLYLLWIA
jgi:cytochrome c-type biogenesis protein